MEQIMNYVKPELFVMVFVLYFFRACLEKAQFVKDNYVKPELVVVAVVLYFIGIALKKSQTVADKYIPTVLGALGMIICGIYVVATCSLSGVQNVAMAIFTAVVQGILVAGLSTYINQIIKQANKEE